MLRFKTNKRKGFVLQHLNICLCHSMLLSFSQFQLEFNKKRRYSRPRSAEGTMKRRRQISKTQDQEELGAGTSISSWRSHSTCGYCRAHGAAQSCPTGQERPMPGSLLPITYGAKKRWTRRYRTRAAPSDFFLWERGARQPPGIPLPTWDDDRSSAPGTRCRPRS